MNFFVAWVALQKCAFCCAIGFSVPDGFQCDVGGERTVEVALAMGVPMEYQASWGGAFSWRFVHARFGGGCDPAFLPVHGLRNPHAVDNGPQDA